MSGNTFFSAESTKKILNSTLIFHSIFDDKDKNYIRMEVQEDNTTRILAFRKPDVTKTNEENGRILLNEINKVMANSKAAVYKCFYIDKKGRKQKNYLLNQAANQVLIDRHKGIRVPFASREKDCIATLEQSLGKKLERNYKVGIYKIDAYCHETNTAYEIDEPHHRYKQEADKIREGKIKKLLNCKFVRIKLS